MENHTLLTEEVRTEVINILTHESRPGYFQQAFTNITPLDKGAFGKVFKVSSLEDDQLYAIKAIILDFDQDFTDLTQTEMTENTSGLMHNFLSTLQECVIQKHFDHESIVRCHEAWYEPAGRQNHELAADGQIENESTGSNPAGEDIVAIIDFMDNPSLLTEQIRKHFQNVEGMAVYLRMDLYDGDLGKHLEHGHGPKHQIDKICFVDILWALEYIHERGYIHRDLSLKNIFFRRGRRNIRFALGDFGMSINLNETGDKSLTENIFKRPGTVPYNTAPDEEYTRKYDIWSLGIVFLKQIGVASVQEMQDLLPLIRRGKLTEALTNYTLLPYELELVEHLLAVNIPNRISAAGALHLQIFETTLPQLIALDYDDDSESDIDKVEDDCS